MRSLTSKLVLVFLLKVFHVALIEYDFLNLFFWEEAWEESGRVVSWLKLLWQITVVTHETLGVCCHLIFEHEEVHYLMEHREGT